MCAGRASCVYCVRSEAHCCGVPSVLLWWPVAQARPTRYGRLARSRWVGADRVRLMPTILMECLYAEQCERDSERHMVGV